MAFPDSSCCESICLHTFAVRKKLSFKSILFLIISLEEPCFSGFKCYGLFQDLLSTTKLDITVIAAIAGYTALRLSIHIDKGYLPKPVIFLRNELLLTGFAYLGIGYLCAAILTSLIVNPWWAILFILFFTVILSEFVIIPLLRQHTYILSGVLMLATVYFYLQYIF